MKWRKKGSPTAKGTVTEGMTKEQVIEILGKPHSSITHGEYLESMKRRGTQIVNTLNIEDPRLKNEYWLYLFDDAEYEITIRNGEVLEVRKSSGRP